MNCPACASLVSTDDPIGGLVICPTCLASIVAEDGRRATSAETFTLTQTDLEKLKKRRAQLRKERAA